MNCLSNFSHTGGEGVIIGLGGVHNCSQLTVLCFLLGAVEVGLSPGLIYYLTFKYRVSERSIRAAVIMASAILGGAFGCAITYGVQCINGAQGPSGWRWLFMIEGASSFVSDILVRLFLPVCPETAARFSAEEKELVKKWLAVEEFQSNARGSR